MGHVIVADLGFGDAGKGTIVDWLCARGPEPVDAVVRFNGGAQAAHNVVTADGRHHTFAQFGSGTFTPGVRTHLSRFMLVDPLALAAEARHLDSLGVPGALDRLTVDGDALLTTPYHRAANRARELRRGDRRHGSCGMGIGETAAYGLAHPGQAPRAGDCRSPARLRGVLARLRGRIRRAFPEARAELPGVDECVDAFLAFGERVRIVDGTYLHGLLRNGNVVFEGAQGVLLDEWHGFHPYTTWSTTTFANAETLLAEAGRTALRLGVIRTYQTRHGPGPFPTEDPALTAELPDAHNGTGAWQGVFRVGHLDAVALRYAVEVCGRVDALALTHLDVARARPDLRVCRAYEIGGRTVGRLTPRPPGDLGRRRRMTERLLTARPVYEPADDGRHADLPAAIETMLGIPVALTSTGPATTGKRQRRPLRRVRPAAPAP
ncbi:adenylosuccinate synthetase [Actinomadura scrupuli]|uniref:adenylosuccinate synthetase n=1 Tax=Actinomadura scrupuli TaxID=559629 RepID=UPI003D96D23B